jgi:hypothetical protein
MIAGIVTWGSGTVGDLSSITHNGTGGTAVIQRRIADASNGGSVAAFFIYGFSVAPTTVTATFGSSQPYRGISLECFRSSVGAVTANQLDGTNETGQLETAPGTGADGANSGSKTPSEDNCLVWAGSANTGSLGGGGSEFTAGSVGTEPTGAEHSVSSEISISSEYEIQTTATARDAAFTVTQNVSHITMMMVFKDVASGGAPALRRYSLPTLGVG